MDIKNIYGVVIFTSAALSIKDALIEAVSKKADLRRADLSRANLRWANLSGADLSRADLYGAKNAALPIARLQFIPTEGAFIGWKMCRDGAIVKLGISKDAKRSHGSGRKCRCSMAKCLAIWRADGTETDAAVSLHDENFVYRVGKVITPSGFDEDRWNTCGEGLHFYITRAEAEAHS